MRANTSSGEWNVCVARGRLFKLSAMASSSSCVCTDKSVPLGRYWRSSPLVFSQVPRQPGAVRIAEVHPDASVGAELTVARHLLSLIVRQALAQRLGNRIELGRKAGQRRGRSS